MNKVNRIKKNHDIASIVQKKQRISRNYYTVYYQYKVMETPRFAFSVSKKYGNAVERNYAKRIARAVVQKKLKELENVLAVIVIKLNAKNKSYQELEKELLMMLTQIKTKNKGEKNEIEKKI